MLRRSFNALLLSLPLLAAAPAFSQEKPKVVTTFTIIADIAAKLSILRPYTHRPGAAIAAATILLSRRRCGKLASSEQLRT